LLQIKKTNLHNEGWFFLGGKSVLLSCLTITANFLPKFNLFIFIYKALILLNKIKQARSLFFYLLMKKYNFLYPKNRSNPLLFLIS